MRNVRAGGWSSFGSLATQLPTNQATQKPWEPRHTKRSESPKDKMPFYTRNSTLFYCVLWIVTEKNAILLLTISPAHDELGGDFFQVAAFFVFRSTVQDSFSGNDAKSAMHTQ